MMRGALAVLLLAAPAAANMSRLREQQHETLRAFHDQQRCVGDACTVKLFFVHLHKCGGTTVEAHLQRMYGDRYLVPDSGDENELRDALVVANASRLARVPTAPARRRAAPAEPGGPAGTCARARSGTASSRGTSRTASTRPWAASGRST